MVEHLSEIFAFLGGLLAGWTLRIFVDQSKRNTANQIANKVGGDMAGRDIDKKK